MDSNTKGESAMHHTSMYASKKYKIVRSYRSTYSKRIVQSGLTLKEAQAHCSNPETSSSTCRSARGKARTKQLGAWFDGYEEE
jgi:hypothetical protein